VLRQDTLGQAVTGALRSLVHRAGTCVLRMPPAAPRPSDGGRIPLPLPTPAPEPGAHSAPPARRPSAPRVAPPTPEVGTVLRLLNRIGTSRWAGPLMRAMVPVDATMQRHTAGRLSIGRAVGLHSLLLTTTGARTGRPRQVPLFHVPYAGGFAVIDSNLGEARPAWSTNLVKDPRATVTARGRHIPIVARHVSTRCDRELRIFHLQPQQPN
jgi:deazaflavin-dependent oxidoreductase (nitroreductase family)